MNFAKPPKLILHPWKRTQTGAPEEAIVHLRHALQIEPAFVSAHNTLGNILADNGALDEAVEHFHEGLRIDPKSAMTHYNLARALAKRPAILKEQAATTGLSEDGTANPECRWSPVIHILR